jgi:hypothetical protein
MVCVRSCNYVSLLYVMRNYYDILELEYSQAETKEALVSLSREIY